MKATAFLIFYAGVLITPDSWVLTLTRDERGESPKAKGEKEVPPPHPSFPLLTLPSFSSFSLPGLNFPYLQAFSQPNRISSSERVKTTKTEYVEVTRRQTVHPVCYTAYETKAPCLPYAQSDFHVDDYDNSELEMVHQIHDGFNLNEVKNAIKPTSSFSSSLTSSTSSTEKLKLPKEKTNGESIRKGKYLQLKLRRNGGEESASKIEGSEFFPIFNRGPAQHQTTEYHTKTVLITKLEKYTDRRVTATLLAVNCLPVDRSIPMCQNYPSPIREAPDRRSDENINFETSNYDPTVINSGAADENSNFNSDLPYDENKEKSTVGNSDSDSEEINTEKTQSL